MVVVVVVVGAASVVVVVVVAVAVAGQVCGQGVSLLTSDLLLLSDASS